MEICGIGVSLQVQLSYKSGIYYDVCYKSNYYIVKR
jgi:hypothetical protein